MPFLSVPTDRHGSDSGVFGTRTRDQALGESHNSLWRVALVRWPVLGLLCLASSIYHPLHNLDLRPLYLLGTWLYVVPFIARLSVHWPRRLTLALAAAGSVLFSLSFLWSAASLGESQSRILTIDQRTILAGVVLRRLESFGDHDGDGVSSWFAGGDCDDEDAEVRPVSMMRPMMGSIKIVPAQTYG